MAHINEVLRGSIDLLDKRSFRKRFKSKSNEYYTLAILIIMGKYILKTFSKEGRITNDSLLRVKSSCNKIMGIWGGAKLAPFWLRKYSSRLSDSAFPPIEKYEEEKKKEIKENCLNLIMAFINYYKSIEVKV